ncbi:hypothetical protein QTL86_21265 [Cellulosilyticum sp. ST5]|uniref:hypothetical protein n=1 Tax=Cellulosilyticum sp. ST5 TaxID=3055805 RepID=UPI0039776755
MDRLNLLAGALSCFVMQAMCLSVFLDQAQLTRKRTIRYSIYASIILAFMFISVENSKFGLLFLVFVLRIFYLKVNSCKKFGSIF